MPFVPYCPLARMVWQVEILKKKHRFRYWRDWWGSNLAAVLGSLALSFRVLSECLLLRRQLFPPCRWILRLNETMWAKHRPVLINDYCLCLFPH